jgi:amidophosphoribosyltransferase
VLLVDDSIVRGNTSSQIVELVRKVGGAKEVHLMVCSPPVKYPCYYGIDTATREELAAAVKPLDELNKFLSSDSLNYLSIDGMMEATGLSPENACMACFSGDYPIPFKAQMRIKYGKEMLEAEEARTMGSLE